MTIENVAIACLSPTFAPSKEVPWLEDSFVNEQKWKRQMALDCGVLI